jgi:DNA transposition AAA+ family ATPase
MSNTTASATGPLALKNVASFMVMTTRLIERPHHLSGLGFGVCHGPSGYGKTQASLFTQNKSKAIRVEIQDSWTRRTFWRAILRELSVNVKERLPIADMAERAINELGDQPNRPVVVDEADKAIDKGFGEALRELQESSGVPVVLIGEEQLPSKLLRVERLHNRVLEWFPAQPCDLDDARALAKAFVPRVAIKDDLLDAMRTQSTGRVRRIIKNLDDAAEFARNKGLTTLDLKAWGETGFFTGQPPQPRSVEMFSRRAPKAAA